MDGARVPVLGVGFDNVTMEQAVRRALALARTGGYVVTPNAEIVYECRKNPAAREAVNAASLVVPDGIGVVYAARILGRPLAGRVPGIELGERLLPELSREGLSLYLLGGKPGVAELAAANLCKKYPGLRICGTHHGYFTVEGPVLADIDAKKPDVLYVCFGAPRQELWMRSHAGALNVRLMMGLGGSIDGYAGIAKRAPAPFRRLGLEWLYRLFKNPRRAGRMARLPLFLLLAVRERLSHVRGH